LSPGANKGENLFTKERPAEKAWGGALTLASGDA